MSTMAASIEPAAEPPHGLQERLSEIVTAFCGDIRFVYIHTVLFTVWIATKGFGNDRFPFNFLTMAVSLEAIFLSTFILISQNRQQALDEANNRIVQDRLLQMLNDVISDEKLDLRNEEMISKVLERIDVERIAPIAAHVESIVACVGRIEAGLAPKPS